MAKYNMTKSAAVVVAHTIGGAKASERPAIVLNGCTYVGKARRSKFNVGNKVTILCRECEDVLASIVVKDPSSHKAPERFLREDLYGYPTA